MKKIPSLAALTPLSLSLALGLGAATIPSVSWADCDGCVISAVNANTNAQITGVVQAIQNQKMSLLQQLAQTTTSIVQGLLEVKMAIGESTNALAKNASENAKQIGENNASVSQAKTKAEAGTKAQKSVADMACAAVSTAGGSKGGGGGGASNNVGPKGSGKNDFQASGSGLSDRLVKAMNASGDTTDPTLPPQDMVTQKADRGVGACTSFASESSSRGFLCRLAGIDPASFSRFINADVQAETLFDGPQDPKDKFTKLSVSSQGEDRTARKAMLSLLDDPLPPPTPSKAGAQTPQFKSYLADKDRYTLLTSMAAQPAYEWDRWTTKDKGTIENLQAIADDETAAPFLSRYIKEHKLENVDSEGVSQAELMNIEVERRVGNKDWILQMAQKDDEAKQAEMMLMQAYSMRIEYARLAEQKRTNVLLGQILSMQVAQTLRPKLNESIVEANSAGLSIAVEPK